MLTFFSEDLAQAASLGYFIPVIFAFSSIVDGEGCASVCFSSYTVPNWWGNARSNGIPNGVPPSPVV